MMKSIVKKVAMMALVCVVAMKAYNKQSEVQVSDVVLANVEALAEGEEEKWISSNCWWVTQYTICDYIGYYEGCPCGSKG